MWGHDTVILTLLYLILHILWFHEIFKLIFPKSSFLPKTMYTEHIGNFPILLVQSFCGALVNSCFLEYATVCVSNQK